MDNRQQQPSGQPPAPAGPKKKESFYLRLVRSRRVRIFFVGAVIVHVLVAVAISTNQTLHDVMFGRRDAAYTPVELSPLEMERGVEGLNKWFTRQVQLALVELVDTRSKLDALQNAKLERLRAGDKEWEEKIKRDGNAATTQTGATTQVGRKKVEYVKRVDVEPPRFGFDPLPDLRNMGVMPMYRLCPPLEQQVGRIYERFHALELAEYPEDPIPLSQGIKNTRMTLPKRRDIRTDVIENAEKTASFAVFQQYRQELKDCFLEVDDMLNTCRRWLDLAESKDRGTVALSGMFGQAYNIVPPPTPYFGHYLNPRLLKKVTMERLLDPPVALGNRIGKGDVTSATEWLGIDRWYYVGPFTHPGAQRRMADLERKYPPETTVNLDDTYQGKDNRKLSWRYRHFGTDFLEKGIRLEPYTSDNESYAIWYFYTEIWSDKDMTVVGSFASDDYGVCWVNDMRVYTSPPDCLPWVPFTRYGFRAVSLRKGFNKVLFKLENALGSTGFSMILMTYEDRALLDAIKKGL